MGASARRMEGAAAPPPPSDEAQLYTGAGRRVVDDSSEQYTMEDDPREALKRSFLARFDKESVGECSARAESGTPQPSELDFRSTEVLSCEGDSCKPKTPVAEKPIQTPVIKAADISPHIGAPLLQTATHDSASSLVSPDAAAGNVRSTEEDTDCLYSVVLSIAGYRIPNFSMPICSLPGLYRPGLAFSKAQLRFDQPLNKENLDEALNNLFAMLLRAETPCLMEWAAESWRRSSDLFVAAHPRLKLALRRTGVSLEELRRFILRYTALAISDPDYYLIACEPDEVIHTVSPSELLLKYFSGEFSSAFLSGLLEELQNSQNSEWLTEKLFKPLIVGIFSELQKRNYNDFQTRMVDALLYLMQPGMASQDAVAEHALFLSNGKQVPAMLESASVLGLLIRPSPLTSYWDASSQEEQDNSKLTVLMKAGNGTAVLSHFRQLQAPADEPSSRFAAAALALAKTKQKVRLAQWLKAFLDGNQSRAQEAMHFRVAAADDRSVMLGGLVLRMNGCSTEGANLNCLWALLNLMKPVKLNKVMDLNPLLVMDEEIVGCLSQMARLVDQDKIKDAAEKVSRLSQGIATPKFPSQILWLCISAVHYLLLPAQKRYLHAARSLENAPPGKGPEVMARLLAYHLVAQHPSFVAVLARYVKIMMTWLSTLFLCYDGDGNVIPSVVASLEKSDWNPTQMLFEAADRPCPPQLALMPVCLFEDLCQVCSVILWQAKDHADRDVFEATTTNGAALLDSEMLTAMTLLTLRCAECFPSPHLRESTGGELLPALLSGSREARLLGNAGVQITLMPGIVRTYIDAQQSGYYGRISQRLSLTRLLERALPWKEHGKALQHLASQDTQLFTRFAAMMVEFLVWVLEEATSQLMEIKKREAGGPTGSPPPPAVATPGTLLGERGASREDATTDEDDFNPAETEQGRNVQEMPIEQLTRTCQSLMDGGGRAFTVLLEVIRYCGNCFVESTLLLPQLVIALNCCLDHLVGPRCLQLKVANAEVYNFEPRKLLRTLCLLYNALRASADGLGSLETVLTAVCTEGRYFNAEVFMKAIKIVKREGLLSKPDLESFAEVVSKICEKEQQVHQQDQWLEEIWDEIPDEFKDPMMEELMEDPVLLPSSNHILDRRHIERHLMTETFDPFNRAPLTKEELIPQPELKKRIEEFLMAKRNNRQI